jgi:zinc transporter, ZIP family
VETTVVEVTLAAFATALATGLGALPFLFVSSMSRRWVGISNALAAGFMLSASVALLVEGATRGLGRVMVGAAIGAIFIAGTRWVLAGHDDVRFGNLKAADAKKAVLIVAVMTVHSFSEGIGVGVSFGGGAALGIFITLAIAIHNIPEGLAISLVLVPRGTRVRAAAGWSIFTSLPQPLLAAPAFLFVEAFRPFLSAGLGFAAGAMTWLVLAELVPDAHKELGPRSLIPWLMASFVAMSLLQLALLTR